MEATNIVRTLAKAYLVVSVILPVKLIAVAGYYFVGIAIVTALGFKFSGNNCGRGGNPAASIKSFVNI